MSEASPPRASWNEEFSLLSFTAKEGEAQMGWAARPYNVGGRIQALALLPSHHQCRPHFVRLTKPTCSKVSALTSHLGEPWLSPAQYRNGANTICYLAFVYLIAYLFVCLLFEMEYCCVAQAGLELTTCLSECPQCRDDRVKSLQLATRS